MRETPQINIQEPPVTELKKQRSCLKRSCVSGCGCIVIFFIAILVLLNLVTGSGFTEVKDVPEFFPADIDLYEAERIDVIKVSDAPVRGGIANVVAIVPKVFLVSTYMVLGDNAPSSIESYYDSVELEPASRWSTFWRLMKEPITPNTRRIEMTWTHLPAEPRFIQEYYQTTLESAAFIITPTAESTARRQLLFEKDDQIGSVIIRDNSPDTAGTDYVQLTVSIPFES